MSKTKHIHQRMNQRGIDQQALELVKMFGIEVGNGEKTILNRKGIEAAQRQLQLLCKKMDKLKQRGGLVLVEANGNEITTYDLNSFSRNKAKAA